MTPVSTPPKRLVCCEDWIRIRPVTCTACRQASDRFNPPDTIGDHACRPIGRLVSGCVDAHGSLGSPQCKNMTEPTTASQWAPVPRGLGNVSCAPCQISTIRGRHDPSWCWPTPLGAIGQDAPIRRSSRLTRPAILDRIWPPESSRGRFTSCHMSSCQTRHSP
jgi:hypothetical protein